MFLLIGLQLFAGLGIPPYKMVLGVPWYGYDYPCVKYNLTVSRTSPVSCLSILRDFLM